MYPFLPAHVTRPKECKKLYFIQLPKSSTSPASFWIIRQSKHDVDRINAEVLSVPKNMKLLAVPLFELYDNTARYGPQLSAIPHLLSRYSFEFVDEDGNVTAATPGGDHGSQTIKVLATGEENGNGHINGGVNPEGGLEKDEIDGADDTMAGGG